MSLHPVIADHALGFTWSTEDPFLFCVHHHDHYPKGNAQLGLNAVHRTGRNIGQDFDPKQAYRLYHGNEVPGFPAHPHCGFETVTLLRKGFIDHADSLGATARFGAGDVQWMTAGKGVQHSEMFPMLQQDQGNELELFQIWLNLPTANKMAEPYFEMLWKEDIPLRVDRSSGAEVAIEVIAGAWNDLDPLSPPPNSYAAQVESELAIWHIQMQANAKVYLPLASEKAKRQLYHYQGEGILIDDRPLMPHRSARLHAHVPTCLHNNSASMAQLLVLQGRPIGEPVVQHGPFVGHSQQAIIEAFGRYQAGDFGQWNWSNNEPVHAADAGRFARYPDGREVRPSVI